MTTDAPTDYWDTAADTFDEEPDHGLGSPDVRAAWAARLRGWLPDEACDVLDLGCGTGSLALLAAEQGHRVTAVDSSARMAELARLKLAGTGARVLLGDAAQPPVGDGRFDVVLVRHVLWALPDPAKALRHWAGLLRRGGRMVLIEGRWGESAPVGFTADALADLAGPVAERIRIEQLAHDSVLWGRTVSDERYAAVLRVARPSRHAEIIDVHLILRRGDEILLARRANTGYADGLFNLPSGHVEDGEDVRTAVLREAYEEVGVVLDPERLAVALVMQHRAPGGSARIGWFFEAHLAESDPQPFNREPDKCSELAWFPLVGLPDDMVAYSRAGVDAHRTGERFVLHLHERGDPIAYAPQGPGRAVVLPGVWT